MNTVVAIAEQNGRGYITPEDVSDALEKHPVNKVREDVLGVLGEAEGAGAEDGSLCAWIAWQNATENE